jgi:hypothetical protein
MDMRVPSRMGSRDDTASMHSQPGHNPYTGSNTSTANMDSTIGYTGSYVPQSSMPAASPIPEQTFMGGNIELRNTIPDYFMQNTVPMLRRGNTMPSTITPASAASVHNPWPGQMGIYSPYSPSSTPSHTPYGPPTRQSASTPQTPVGPGSFQGMQLPPPPHGHQQAHLGHRPSHSNLGGEGGGHQYDASGPMGSQMGPATHTNSLGFTEFLHRDLPGEDGSGRGKME